MELEKGSDLSLDFEQEVRLPDQGDALFVRGGCNTGRQQHLHFRICVPNDTHEIQAAPRAGKPDIGKTNWIWRFDRRISKASSTFTASTT